MHYPILQLPKNWKIYVFVFSSNSVTQTFKVQMEAREKWVKESSVVNLNNAIYIDEAAFYEGDVTHKNGYLQVKSIQSNEQELTLNTMCLAWFTSQEFLLLNCLKEVWTVINS